MLEQSKRGQGDLEQNKINFIGSHLVVFSFVKMFSVLIY